MNGVQTRFKCKLDVKRCKRFVFPPSSLLPRSNALKTKAIRYFQTDRTLTRIVSPPLYKAQINPHFLFNTLNALYGLVLTKSDKTESAFIKFSNILKYMYAQTTMETISINNEVEYIRQYVDLQSLRLNKHTQVVFETQIDDEHAKIPPMILITFVENTFKYGVSSDVDCLILIRITVKKGELLFETENTVMKENHANPHAIGIENCRKRLELLYPNRFTLIMKEENRQFKIRLSIQL